MGNKSLSQELDEKLENEINHEDENKHSQKFVDATQLFFRGLRHLALERYPNGKSLLRMESITIEDIKYLDGYSTTEKMPNDIVHFSIKECPNWLFAIWWKQPGDANVANKNIIHGEFFCQYKDAIDKFKPSTSRFVAKLIIPLWDNNSSYGSFDAAKIISFIHNEPALAFCRDYHYWDYNTEYHTRGEAKRRFEAFKFRQANEIELTSRATKLLLEFAEQKLVPMFKGAFIHNNGSNVSPQYELIAPLDLNTDLVTVAGCYYMFDDKEEPEYIEWIRLTDELEEEAHKKDVVLYSTSILSSSITFIKDWDSVKELEVGGTI